MRKIRGRRGILEVDTADAFDAADAVNAVFSQTGILLEQQQQQWSSLQADPARP